MRGLQVMTITDSMHARLNQDRRGNWRTPLLNATSKILAIVGSIWLLVVTSGSPAAVLTLRGFTATVLVGLIWIATIFKRMPEAVRLSAILAGFMGVASINIITSGPGVPGVVLPLMLVLLMAILYRGLWGALATGVAILVVFVVGA